MPAVNIGVLPNLVIAGVNKAGTTSLFRYLATHPEICASSVKETCYFLPIRYGEPLTPIEDYMQLFSHYNGEKITMEATPGYFYGGADLASAIRSRLDNPKIVLLLREPVSRFFSFFEFMKSSLLLDKEIGADKYFNKCLEISQHDLGRRESNPYFGLEGGCYARYLPAWKETFGNNLKIIFFDELVSSPLNTLQDLAAFLGISAEPFNGLAFNQENKTRGYSIKWLHALALFAYNKSRVAKHPKVHRLLTNLYYRINGAPKTPPNYEIKVALEKYYSNCNRNLAEMVGDFEGRRRTLPSWVLATSVEE